MESASEYPAIEEGFPCQASADSILDYGQYVILSTGNFLCSAPTVNSTMDFSRKPIDEGVVDSPPDKKKRLSVSCSPSPLRSKDLRTSSMSPTASNKGTQRKLYGDANYPTSIAEEKSEVQVNTLRETVLVPKCKDTCPSASHGMLLSTSSDRRHASTSKGSRPHIPRFRSPLLVRRKCNTHGDPKAQLQDGHRPCYSWEERSLKKQRREDASQTSVATTRYSRGPEILQAMEKLKSRSYS